MISRTKTSINLPNFIESESYEVNENINKKLVFCFHYSCVAVLFFARNKVLMMKNCTLFCFVLKKEENFHFKIFF